MELRVLRYFLAVAREENFTRAAEQLHVTQPTLSRQIADLEQELGVKLFRRSNHNIILTEDGVMLKHRAQEILSLAEKTKQDLLYKEEHLEGTITIGSGEFQSTRILMDCIAAFHKKYPQVHYELYSGNVGNIQDNIERGLLDLGLISEPIDIRKYDFLSMPVLEEWGALVREDSPLAEKSTLSPQDLVDLPVVAAATPAAQSNLRKWFGQSADKINIIAKGNLLYNQALLGQSSNSISIAIRLSCQYDGLRFLPFSPPLQSGTALVWKKEQFFSAATTTFLAFAKKYILSISNYDL